MRFFLSLFLLTACSSQVLTNAVIQQDTPVSIPTAQPLTLNTVQWQVMSVNELKVLESQLQKAQGQNQVVFVLDNPNYTNLQLNLVEIQRYIKEQKAILTMLKQVLNERSGNTQTTSNSKTTKTNSTATNSISK